jgi:uracil-DNA glycosylase
LGTLKTFDEADMTREFRQERQDEGDTVRGVSPTLIVPDTDLLLEQYQRRMATCTRCVEAGYLHEANPIFHGYARQRVMIVGQAPGVRAHTTGMPWSGRSGEILRDWLANAGFPPDQWRETWYLTSLTKCFPGKAAQGKGDRAPSRAEIALCGDHLEMELKLVRPEVIVTLGKMAASRLLPGASRQPLSTLVGTLATVDLPHGPTSVVPLPHPSGVSRWLNDAANRDRVDEGLFLLNEERERLGM